MTLFGWYSVHPASTNKPLGGGRMTTEVEERTGFLNYRRELMPDVVDNDDFVAHVRRHMRLTVGEAIIQRLVDGRQYVVRMWEGMEVGLRGREWFSIPDMEDEYFNTEVPFHERPFRPHRAHVWMTGLIVLRDYRDAFIGEYVAHTEQTKGRDVLLVPEMDPDSNSSSPRYMEQRFEMVKFRLPGEKIAHVLQRVR